MSSRSVFRGLFGLSIGGAVVVAAACSGGSGKKGPGFTSLSQLNAVWSLTGTYSFVCNGTPENVAITNAKVWIYDGAFSQYLPWPAAICGSSFTQFQGIVNADGSITGTASINNGGSQLSDTLAGSCSATSCSGNTANTAELTFTMTNTGTNPFDGGSWNALVQCSDGGGPSTGSPITIAQGHYSGATQGYVICTSGAKIVIASGTPVPGTFSVTITSDGNFSASVTQGTADTLSFSTTMTGLTQTGIVTGTDGAKLQLARPTPS